MVDVNTQNKTISVNVSSSGVSSNVNASGDTSHYYSEKAREWAISNRIVDGVDYSSKYYAGKANESALNAQSFAQSAQDSYNNFQQSVDGALSNVDSVVQGGIEEINNTKTGIITDIELVADGEKQDIQELADNAKDDIKSTGFYMRDDKLYFINSKGEEEEILEQVNQGLESRVNLEATNLSSEGKSLVAGLAMPSDKYVDLTVGANGTRYSAPANGYVSIIANATSAVAFINLLSTSIPDDYSKPIQVDSFRYNAAGQWHGVSILVRKGQEFTISYDNISIQSAIFVYAQGEV